MLTYKVPDHSPVTLAEAEARIAQLEAENAILESGMRRAQADMQEIIDQVERLDMTAWAQIKYAADNGLPIPEVEPKAWRKSSDLPIVSLHEPDEIQLGWIRELLRHFAAFAVGALLGVSAIM